MLFGNALAKEPPGSPVMTAGCAPAARDCSTHSPKGTTGPTALYVPVVPACAESSSQAARSRTSMTCVGRPGEAGTSIGVPVRLRGRLADTVGHRKMVTLGVIVFAGASALCGLDPRAARPRRGS